MTKIAMIIAMNASLIGVISWLSSGVMGALFQIYPGTRMFIENTLIKIGALLFGPILGIFIGAITDLLTVILTSSIVNYGYWIVAIINGFLGGVIYLLIRMKDEKRLKSTLISIVLTVVFLIYFSYFLSCNLEDGYAQVKILSSNISLSRGLINGFMWLIAMSIISVLIASVVSNYLIKQDQYKENKLVNFLSKNNIFFQICCINFISVALVDIVALPLFDQKISTLPYQQFVIMRLTTMIPYLIISTIIICNIYKLSLGLKPKNEIQECEKILLETKNKGVNLNV